MKRLTALLALALVTLAAAACGSGSAGTPSGSASPAPSADPGRPLIVADQIRFERDRYEVPAGKPFTLVFENRESAPHNVAVYTDSSAKTPLFVGEIFGGAASRPYALPSLAAGAYFFRCDVHPDMQGTLVAG